MATDTRQSEGKRAIKQPIRNGFSTSALAPQKRTSIKTSSSNREMSDETREKAQGRKGYDQLEQPDGGALNQRFKKGASLQATLTECRMDTRR